MVRVITIGRQCGSGGHSLGVALANRLGVPYYDKTYLAREWGDLFDRFDSRPGGLLYTLSAGGGRAASLAGASLERDAYRAGMGAIRELAKKDCVVIGRGGNWALRGVPGCMHLFVRAPLARRAERVAAEQRLSPEEARGLIRRADGCRAAYYRFYTGGQWGGPEGYDCCLDLRLLGQEETVAVLCRVWENIR